MKYLIVLLASFTLLGCENPARQVLSGKADVLVYWSHPEYGEVTQHDPRYIAFRESCSNDSYRSSLEIEGKTYAKDEYVKKYNDYVGPRLRETVKRLRSEQAMAHYGALNTTAVKHDYAYYYKMASLEFFSNNHPAYVFDVKKMIDKYDNCFSNNPEWKRLRTVYISKKSGKKIRVVNH